MSQMRAVLAHHVSAERLQKISKDVPRIVIVAGDDDQMVDVRNSSYLKDNMPEAELIHWEGTGHVLQAQWPERYNKLLEKTIQQGRENCIASTS